MAGPHADAVKTSIRAHDPAARDTLTDATESVQAVRAHEARSPRVSA